MEPSRESIFFSALRTFCRMFFGLVAIFFAIVLCSLAYSLLAPSPLIEDKTTLTILPDASGKREVLSLTTPAVLQIPIHGVIGEPQKLDSEIIRNILLDSQTGLLTNNRVKGILLHFNTPGGAVVDSDEIYRMLNDYKARYKVPIVGYVEGLCASGGMYIASSADTLFAGPASVIGSVGVIIGPFFNIYDMMGKIGIQARTITEGLDKDMMSPVRPWQEGEDKSLKAITAFMYHRFVDILTQARTKLDKTKLVQEYGAKVYDCVTAEELGYIDYAMTSRDDALLFLLKQAGIDPSTPYQVVSLSPKNALFTELLKGKSPLLSGKIEHTFGSISNTVLEQPCYLYTYE